MASTKTGIALLSMYNDEDDDMEDLNEEEQDQQFEDEEMEEIKEGFVNSEATPPVVDDNSTPKVSKFSSSFLESQGTGSSPILHKRVRRGAVTIVDYGHDEVAMSPEAEEGEALRFNGESQTAKGDPLEETPGSVSVLTPSAGDTSQLSGLLISQSVTVNITVRESEAAENKNSGDVHEEALKVVDPLDSFLPSPPEERCSEELQDRINKFLALKRAGKSFNAEVRNKKDYRNPDFLLHAVRYQDIDQIGSCFSKDVFDPHGYDPSDFYDEIEADVKREAESKEQERKKSLKVEFHSGGTQPASNTGFPTPGVPTGSGGGSHSVPTTKDTVVRDGRSKKSKWDKVDGDRKNSVGHDSIPNAQQRRREE